jgi:tetratricopeptide (TPR) repeat protein
VIRHKIERVRAIHQVWEAQRLLSTRRAERQEAVARYFAAVVVLPDIPDHIDAEFRLEKGKNLLQNKNFEAAAEEFGIALARSASLDPYTLYELHARRGASYFRQALYDMAIRDFEEALKIGKLLEQERLLYRVSIPADYGLFAAQLRSAEEMIRQGRDPEGMVRFWDTILRRSAEERAAVNLDVTKEAWRSFIYFPIRRVSFRDESITEPSECDRLASDPLDPLRVFTAVEMDQIDPAGRSCCMRHGGRGERR